MDAAFRLAEDARLGRGHLTVYAGYCGTCVQAGIEQWDELYPDADVLRGDIENGEMYVVERGGDILFRRCH